MLPPPSYFSSVFDDLFSSLKTSLDHFNHCSYLKMKLNTLGEVKDVRKALEELPPFPKQESEDTSTETGEPVKAEGEGGEKEHKEEEKPENVDEGADKKEEKSGEVAKEQEVVEKSNKRGISILIYTDHISESLFYFHPLCHHHSMLTSHVHVIFQN